MQWLAVPRLVPRAAVAALAAATVLPTTTTDGSAHALDLIVASLTEAGDSLRDAVSDANADAAITRLVLPSAGPYLLTTCGTFENFNNQGDLDITRSTTLTIVGTGSSPAIIQQQCEDRVIDHRGAGALILENVQIDRGSLPDRSITSSLPANEYDGGGIRSLVGDLTLVDSIVVFNSASDGGQGSATLARAGRPGGDGGGIWSGPGDVTLFATTIDRNDAGTGGAGNGPTAVPGSGGAGGGIYSTGGIVRVLDGSTISNNAAGDGGVATGSERGGTGGSGGGISHAGNIEIRTSTVARNTGGDGGDADPDPFTGGDGGDGGFGGGINIAGLSRTTTIVDSEIRENSAGNGGTSIPGAGGDGADGGGVLAATVLADNVEFISNTAGDGGSTKNNVAGHGGDGGALAVIRAEIVDSFFQTNSAGDGGDGTEGGFGGHGGDGGAIAAQDEVEMNRSGAWRNRAGDGGDATNGGFGGDGGVMAGYSALVVTPTPTYRLIRSSFNQNSAGNAGLGRSDAANSGFAGWGGVAHTVENVNGAFSAENSLFSGNSAGRSDGPAEKQGDGAVTAVNNLTLVASTVVGNNRGTALTNARTGLTSFDRFTANVIGSNDGGNCDLAANQSGGWNRVTGPDSCGLADATDQVGQTSTGLVADRSDDRVPRLLPIVGGPLDERIPSSSCGVGFLAGVDVDLDGLPRPLGDGCEPGAYEIGDLPVRPGSPLDRAARFVPIEPTRIFDTRPGLPGAGPKGRLSPGQTIEVQFAGRAPIPSGAVAVVVNVTATQTDGPSFVTAFPTGSSRPTASSINIVSSGQTRPNLVTVPIGDGGRVSFFSLRAAHLLGDVAGYYLDADESVAAGRFEPLVPERIFDSRPGEPAPGPKGKLAAGGSVDVQVAGVGRVPAASQVSAVVINLTGTQADAPGFLTATPTGIPRPVASNVNLSVAGDTAPNLAIVPLGTDGQITIFSSHGAHAIVDITGYYTSDASGRATEGLFVPLDPVRVFDTRPEEAAPGPKGRLAAGDTIDVEMIAPSFRLPFFSKGIVLNVTGVQSPLGFVTAFPTGESRPPTSTLNFQGSSDTRANAAILPVGSGDELSFFSRSGGHLLADASGYFLGPPFVLSS